MVLSKAEPVNFSTSNAAGARPSKLASMLQACGVTFPRVHPPTGRRGRTRRLHVTQEFSPTSETSERIGITVRGETLRWSNLSLKLHRCQSYYKLIFFHLHVIHLSVSVMAVSKLLLVGVALSLFTLQVVDGRLKAEYHEGLSDCGAACMGRCSKASRQDRCVQVCGSCCRTCNCVPPGTFGNKEKCLCYAGLTTHAGRPKCP
ncbi:Gibberellin-regulated protein 10 [Nymphaea thermarum]|nr:Gibberellin-regulated protein 10 [Nymphaea thermarum]